MIKDAIGNEVKVGDTLLIQLQGLTMVKVTSIYEGGLSMVQPGAKQAIEIPGCIRVQLDQDINFTPGKPLPFYKIEVPEEKKNNKDGKPN